MDKRATEKLNAFIQENAKGKDFSSIEDFNQFLGQLIGGKRLDDMELRPSTPRQAAQAKMYEAFDAPSKSRRVTLAKEALAIFPDCADAYVLLAESEEKLEKALTLYKQGVEAGRRALGDEYIKEHKGSLWMCDGRPYLRAMQGAVECLLELEQYEDAAATAKEMLILNEHDNQGVRYMLLTALIMSKKFAEANKVLDKHKDETSAQFLYSRALIMFQLGKNPKATDAAVEKALAYNPFVPALLLTPDLMPGDEEMPDSYSPGSFDEAVLYCAKNIPCWYADIPILQWLQCISSMHMLTMATELHKQKEDARRNRLSSKIDKAGKGAKILDLNHFLGDNK